MPLRRYDQGQVFPLSPKPFLFGRTGCGENPPVYGQPSVYAP